MPDLAVVHLVRRQNGLPPFERFLSSYREHPAGTPHDLVILFKGFPAGDRTQDYDRLLEDTPHRKLFVSDRGFRSDRVFQVGRAARTRALLLPQFLQPHSR